MDKFLDQAAGLLSVVLFFLIFVSWVQTFPLASDNLFFTLIYLGVQLYYSYVLAIIFGDMLTGDRVSKPKANRWD